MICYGHCDRT